MKLYEIDWRYSSTRHIFEVLTESLKDVVAKLHEAEQSGDELYKNGKGGQEQDKSKKLLPSSKLLV